MRKSVWSFSDGAVKVGRLSLLVVFRTALWMIRSVFRDRQKEEDCGLGIMIVRDTRWPKSFHIQTAYRLPCCVYHDIVPYRDPCMSWLYGILVGRDIQQQA